MTNPIITIVEEGERDYKSLLKTFNINDSEETPRQIKIQSAVGKLFLEQQLKLLEAVKESLLVEKDEKRGTGFPEHSYGYSNSMSKGFNKALQEITSTLEEAIKILKQ